ncbi:hypothetical protein V6N12_053382 [Hibiscus sabdariffa]|uniref:RNase H type-1 domain-containing protein n=1 Tax=Hibiscus sabdariffa TaxID=183260 RepID=A0ABR2D884_9ROSI
MFVLAANLKPRPLYMFSATARELDRRSLQVGAGSRSSIRDLSWASPSSGWVKVNCDAAVDQRNNSAAIGGVIRDSTGSRIISGCTSAFGSTLLIEDILELMSRRWTVHLRYISRVQNVVADTLAAICRGQDMGELVWYDPPEAVLDALQTDRCNFNPVTL